MASSAPLPPVPVPVQLSDPALAASLARRAVSGATRPVVLIDGRSGSGKTTLAAALVPLIPGAQLVALDDVYPGWDGLAAASEALESRILTGVAPGYRRWDWQTSTPSSWRALSPTSPLVVEGAGALTARSARAATLRIWVELDETTRRERALGRDGESYEPWWEMWAAQEDSHIALHQPRSLADVVVAG